MCLVLLIHGGGFVFGAPEAVLNREAVEQAGVATWSLGYPLGDVRRAYRWTAAAVPKNRPTVAFGESAGGTIAAWLAARRHVDAAITVGAPTDLSRWPESPAHREAIGLTTGAWRYSPARTYRQQRPLWAIHWTHDPIVPFAHAAALRGAHLKTLWGGGHTEAPTHVIRSTIAAACTRARHHRRRSRIRQRTSEGSRPASAACSRSKT
jgi:acetyl esterase/lipase